VWETVGFLLNGFVFILIGLELPVIVEGLGNYSMEEAIRYALLISVMVILIRIVLVYFTSFVPRWLSPQVRARERSPGTKLPFIIGWAGMRGVVSLASALAIPLVLNNGEAFPQRNLILFITFVVILVTLVFQGLTLPIFLRLLKVEEIDDVVPIEEQLESIRLRLAKEAVAHMDRKYAKEMAEHETIARVKEQFVRSIQATELALNEDGKKEELASVRRLQKKISLELLNLRRAELHRISEEKRYDDEVIRDLEYNLDLEEARLNKQ